MTDPLCIIKKEVFEQDPDVDQDMDENVNDYIADHFMDNSHDDNDVPYGVDGGMNDENLKIYIDEALQVTLSNFCQCSGDLNTGQKMAEIRTTVGARIPNEYSDGPYSFGSSPNHSKTELWLA